MVEKEIRIKVSTEADTSQVQDLQELLEQLQQNGNIQFEADVDVKDIETLESELEAAKSNVEDLENQLVGIEMGTVDGDFDEVSQQLEEASARVDELQSSLDSLNPGGSNDIPGTFDEMGGSADKANEEIDELQGSLDLMNAGALMGISSELGALGDKAEGMAQDMNNAAITVGQLATQTGIAEPQLVDMINHISNATFPQSEAMMYVKSLDQIGVSSGNLGKSATDLDKINDAFGLGANTVNSLGQELSVLGVDMNNVSSSFNALAYANSNTVGGMENYYAFLRKYDAQFKELGFNVDQASVIIAGATQKYGGGRAALSGLSTALKDANGDTRALEEALGLQAGSIENASQLTGEYEGQLQSLADEEAEHKTWLDQLGAAWEDMTLKLSPVLSPLASFMGIVGQAGSFAVGINGITTLANNFRKLEIVKSIGGKLDGLKGKLSGVGSAARTTGGHILTLAKNLGSSVLTAAKNAGTAFFNLGKEVWNAGINAIKSAGAWLIAKGQLVVSTLATWAQTAAQTALNFVMNMNPIMLVVMAIGALIAVLGYLYFNNEQVRAAVDGLGQSLMMFGQWVYNGAIYWLQQLQTTLMNLWNYIVTLGGLLPANVQITGNSIIDTIIRVLAFIATLPLQLGMIFINILARVLGFGNNFSQRMLTAAWNAVTNFGNAIAQIPSRLATELGNALNKVNEWAATLPQKFWDAGVNAVKNFLNALGIHSPGTMQRMLVWEVSEMGRRVPEEGERLLSNVSRLGSDVVDSFGEPSLGLRYDDTLNSQIETGNAGNTGNTGDIYNFNLYGDMDNEERMNRFVDEVIRRLNFENETAGRTV